MFSMPPSPSGEALRKGGPEHEQLSAQELQEKARIRNAIITVVKNRSLIIISFPNKKR